MFQINKEITNKFLVMWVICVISGYIYFANAKVLTYDNVKKWVSGEDLKRMLKDVNIDLPEMIEVVEIFSKGKVIAFKLFSNDSRIYYEFIVLKNDPLEIKKYNFDIQKKTIVDKRRVNAYAISIPIPSNPHYKYKTLNAEELKEILATISISTLEVVESLMHSYNDICILSLRLGLFGKYNNILGYGVYILHKSNPAILRAENISANTGKTLLSVTENVLYPME